MKTSLLMLLLAVALSTSCATKSRMQKEEAAGTGAAGTASHTDKAILDRQKATDDKFRHGWKRLRKGMTPSEIQDLIGYEPDVGRNYWSDEQWKGRPQAGHWMIFGKDGTLEQWD